MRYNQRSQPWQGKDTAENEGKMTIEEFRETIKQEVERYEELEKSAKEKTETAKEKVQHSKIELDSCIAELEMYSRVVLALKGILSKGE